MIALPIHAPVRVYLDTQDYFNLYKNRSTDQEKIFKFLINKVESGEIEIGFSYLAFSEFLQNLDPKFKDDRIERARFMKLLCRKNAFIFFNRIVNYGGFSSDGEWYPDVISKGLVDIGQLSQKIIDQAKSSGDPNAHLLTPEVTNRVVLGIIRGLFADVEFIISFKFNNGGQMESIGNTINDFITSYAEKLPLLRQDMKDEGDKVRSERKKLRETEQAARREGQYRLIQDQIEKRKAEIGKVPEMTKEKIHEAINNWSKLKDVLPPSFFDSLAAYFYGTLRGAQDVKTSDWLDIMHSIYIPYCDLWRGDKAFCSLLIQGDVQYKGRLVPTLAELPDRIEKTLAERAGIGS